MIFSLALALTQVFDLDPQLMPSYINSTPYVAIVRTTDDLSPFGDPRTVTCTVLECEKGGLSGVVKLSVEAGRRATSAADVQFSHTVPAENVLIFAAKAPEGSGADAQMAEVIPLSASSLAPAGDLSARVYHTLVNELKGSDPRLLTIAAHELQGVFELPCYKYRGTPQTVEGKDQLNWSLTELLPQIVAIAEVQPPHNALRVLSAVTNRTVMGGRGIPDYHIGDRVVSAIIGMNSAGEIYQGPWETSIPEGEITCEKTDLVLTAMEGLQGNSRKLESLLLSTGFAVRNPAQLARYVALAEREDDPFVLRCMLRPYNNLYKLNIPDALLLADGTTIEQLTPFVQKFKLCQFVAP